MGIVSTCRHQFMPNSGREDDDLDRADDAQSKNASFTICMMCIIERGAQTAPRAPFGSRTRCNPLAQSRPQVRVPWRRYAHVPDQAILSIPVNSQPEFLELHHVGVASSCTHHRPQHRRHTGDANERTIPTSARQFPPDRSQASPPQCPILSTRNIRDHGKRKKKKK